MADVAHKLSASQISTYESCETKWGWTYIVGIRGEPNKSAELGSQVHAVLERYLRGEGWDLSTDAGEIALSAAEHLPQPKSGDVEYAFEFSKDGVTYLGYKDFRRLGEVWDHKTTSDFKWAKTPEDLQHDTQAVLYAVDEFLQGAETVDLYWSYMRTRGARKSRLVHLRMVPEQASKAFDRIHETGKKIVAQYAAGLAAHDSTAYVLSLKKNTDHCGAYGGCPHRERCGIGPFKGDDMSSIEETMAKIRAAAGNMPVAAPPKTGPVNRIEPPDPVNPPEKAAVAPPPPPEPKPKKAAKAKALTVYLDCMPLGGEHLFFDDLVREAAKRIHAEHGMADYRFIQFHAGAVLLGTVQALLDEKSPTSIVVRDSQTPEALICSSMLVSRADLVVVGS